MLQLIAPLAICLGDAQKYLLPARHTITRCGWKIGAAEKRPLGGRQKNVHRPAATSGRELDKIHIDLVNVRTLFHIDLDVYEMLVLDCRRRFILERLVLHYMTPVTRRVADAHKHSLVLCLS